MSPELEELAQRLEGEQSPAAVHLQKAWHAVYGRSPSPTEGYAEAIRAVEAAGSPIVSPKENRPSVGKMAQAIRDSPSKWSSTLPSPDEGKPVTVVAQMLDLLITSQQGRHGTAAGVFVPSPEAAEAALTLAIVLVHWFRTGAIFRA